MQSIIVPPEYLDIPRDYYRLHHFVTLTADIMFVNGLPFLTIMSRDVRFGTAGHVPSRTARQLVKSLMEVVKVYAMRDRQARMAHPTNDKFKQMVSSKSLQNCSIVACGTSC